MYCSISFLHTAQDQISQHTAEHLKLKSMNEMGVDTRKPQAVFGGLQITQAQNSQRIATIRSAPLLFAFWKVSCPGLPQAKFQISR